MARPFSIARAITAFDNNKLVEGFLDSERFIKADNDHFCMIDPDTVSYNTGLTDRDDNEIFTGDLLRKFHEQSTVVEVVFMVEEGAFFIKHIEHSRFHANRYPNPTECFYDRTDIVYERLTQEVARQYFVAGSVQTELVPLPEDTWYDPQSTTIEGATS